MAPASADPQRPSGRSDVDRLRQQDHREQAVEKPELCGPLEVERHIKDDGRSLILYTRREGRDA